MGVSGMFANSLKKALNAIIPKKLWPKIKKRLRFALNQRGKFFNFYGEIFLRIAFPRNIFPP